MFVLPFVALLIGCESTPPEYASGFTRQAFEALPLGSSQEQALASLGEPLDRWYRWGEQGAVVEAYWAYSRRRELGSLYFDVLVFSPDGRLIARHEDYFVD